jgi:hypothetical protein
VSNRFLFSFLLFLHNACFLLFALPFWLTEFRGPTALSEPETDALARYAAKIFPKQQRRGTTYPESYDKKNVACNSQRSTGVYIDVHAFGGQIYYVRTNYITTLEERFLLCV